MTVGLEQPRERVEFDPGTYIVRNLCQRHDAGRGEKQDPQRLAGEDPGVREPHAEESRRPRYADRDREGHSHDYRQPEQRDGHRDPVVRHTQREHQEARGEREPLRHDGREREQQAVKAPVEQDRLTQSDGVHRAVERQQHDLERDDGTGDRKRRAFTDPTDHDEQEQIDADLHERVDEPVDDLPAATTVANMQIASGQRREDMSSAGPTAAHPLLLRHGCVARNHWLVGGHSSSGRRKRARQFEPEGAGRGGVRL